MHLVYLKYVFLHTTLLMRFSLNKAIYFAVAEAKWFRVNIKNHLNFNNLNNRQMVRQVEHIIDVPVCMKKQVARA